MQQDSSKVTIEDQYEVSYVLSIGAKNQRPRMTLNSVSKHVRHDVFIYTHSVCL